MKTDLELDNYSVENGSKYNLENLKFFEKIRKFFHKIDLRSRFNAPTIFNTIFNNVALLILRLIVPRRVGGGVQIKQFEVIYGIG